MFVQYGSFVHPAGEPAITIDRETLYTDANTPWAEKVRWTINGMIVNQSGVAADMSAKLAALEAAYSVDGQDLQLLLPDGSTASEHKLLNADTLGGTRVVQRPSYPEGKGAEYITLRTFTLAVEAEVEIASATRLLSWHETIRFTGGGPRYGHLEPLLGRPIRQKLKRNTIFKAVQSGRAVGLYGYPIVPQAMWPFYLMDQPDIEQQAPRRRGFGSGVDTFTEWPVSWTFRFEAGYPMRLIQGPNRWRQ